MGNKIWSTKLTKDGCVSKVFDFNFFFYLYANKFDLGMTKIKIGEEKVPLNTNEFRWLL